VNFVSNLYIVGSFFFVVTSSSQKLSVHEWHMGFMVEKAGSAIRTKTKYAKKATGKNKKRS
jgi:hypothetical protein